MGAPPHDGTEPINRLRIRARHASYSPTYRPFWDKYILRSRQPSAEKFVAGAGRKPTRFSRRPSFPPFIPKMTCHGCLKANGRRRQEAASQYVAMLQRSGSGFQYRSNGGTRLCAASPRRNYVERRKHDGGRVSALHKGSGSNPT